MARERRAERRGAVRRPGAPTIEAHARVVGEAEERYLASVGRVATDRGGEPTCAERLGPRPGADMGNGCEVRHGRRIGRVTPFASAQAMASG